MSAIMSLALMASAAHMMDAETTRVAYNNCLVDFSTEQLDLKTTTSSFRKVSKDACTAERNAMIAAIKKDELAYGSTASEAEEYALEEADGVLFSFSDMYSGFLDSNTRPMKQ